MSEIGKKEITPTLLRYVLPDDCSDKYKEANAIADVDRVHVEWYGIRFTELVKSCSWIGQAGGTGMMGGASSTYKIPKDAFTLLSELLPTL